MCYQIHKAYDKNQGGFCNVGRNIYFKSAKISDILFLLKIILPINTFKTSNKNKPRTGKQSLEDVSYSCSSRVSSCCCKAWLIP